MSEPVVSMPDVNTLVAAAWPNHVHHELARRWLMESSSQGWASCPLVQTRVQGYRQVTDAILLATVVHHDGVLATLDAGILSLLPAAEAYRVRVIAAL